MMGCSQSKDDSSPPAITAPIRNADSPLDLRTAEKNRRQQVKPLDGSPTSTRPGTPPSAVDPRNFVQHSVAQFSEKYAKGRKLGSGGYGDVILCRHKVTGAPRAVKVIKKSLSSPLSENNLIGEVSVLRQLDHPNIMKLYEFFEDRRNYYLVCEAYTGGELFDAITERQRFTERDAANTMKQLFSGVIYLHKHNIVHRDLKPENLLLESRAKDALIKIVDFGLSSVFDPSKKMKEKLGTAFYIAPEVLKHQYDQGCDVWSLGVILYILLCGYPPFGGNTDKEILQKVSTGKFYFDPAEWSTISSSAKDLITRMLTFEPSKRITADACMRHSWVMEGAEKDEVKLPSLIKALGNMQKFQVSQKLAQAALLFMGSKLTTLDETKELTRIFQSLDANGDGQLDRKELIAGYRELMQKNDEDSLTQEQIEEEIDKILDSADFDKNGFIDYSEFVTVSMDKKVLLSRSRLEAAFNLFDIDKSGSIAAEELRHILNDVDDEQWSRIIQEVDSNNDGEVDFEEFVAMMQKIEL